MVESSVPAWNAFGYLGLLSTWSLYDKLSLLNGLSILALSGNNSDTYSLFLRLSQFIARFLSLLHGKKPFKD